MHSDLSTSRQANPCLTTLLNICRKPHGTIGTKFAYRHLQVNQSWTLGVRHHNSSVNYHCLWSDILQTASNENSRFICVRLKCLIFLCVGVASLFLKKFLIIIYSLFGKRNSARVFFHERICVYTSAGRVQLIAAAVWRCDRVDRVLERTLQTVILVLAWTQTILKTGMLQPCV